MATILAPPALLCRFSALSLTFSPYPFPFFVSMKKLWPPICSLFPCCSLPATSSHPVAPFNIETYFHGPLVTGVSGPKVTCISPPPPRIQIVPAITAFFYSETSIPDHPLPTRSLVISPHCPVAGFFPLPPVWKDLVHLPPLVVVLFLSDPHSFPFFHCLLGKISSIVLLPIFQPRLGIGTGNSFLYTSFLSPLLPSLFVFYLISHTFRTSVVSSIPPFALLEMKPCHRYRLVVLPPFE